jgi:hypothetical protein
MKDIGTIIGLCGASAVGSRWAGAPWQVTVAVMLFVCLLTYWAVFRLADPSRSRSVSCFLISWEAPTDHDKPRKRPKGR